MNPSSNKTVSVYMWWCGDEECDCTKPIVEIRSLERPLSPGWESPERIAEGPFVNYSGGYPEPEELKAQKKWLAGAKAWYKWYDPKAGNHPLEKNKVSAA